MDIHGAKMIGAGLAVLGVIGAGIGVGNIFSSLIQSIARNPAEKAELQKFAFIGMALTEALGIFSLLVAFVILGK